MSGRHSLGSEVPVEKGGTQHIEQYGSQDAIEHLDIDEKKVLRKMCVFKTCSYSPLMLMV